MNNGDSHLQKFNKLTLKGKKNVEKICKIATKILSNKGFAMSTLADISHATGISKGGIYHYFSTKDELFYLILYKYMENTLLELRKKLESVDEPQEKLWTFIHQDIEYFCENIHESKLLFREAQNLPPKYWNIIKKKEKEYVNILKSIVYELIGGYKKHPLKIQMVTYSILGMVNWPYVWYNPDGQITPHELAEEIYSIVLGNLPIKGP